MRPNGRAVSPFLSLIMREPNLWMRNRGKLSPQFRTTKDSKLSKKLKMSLAHILPSTKKGLEECSSNPSSNSSRKRNVLLKPKENQNHKKLRKI